MNGEARVEVLADAESVSASAAEQIATILRRATDDHGRADWTTTGGSTPAGIYRHLATPPLRDRVTWPAVHLWWGDDRYVPRDHPLSNVLPADQILLEATARAGLSGTGATGGDVITGREPAADIPIDNIHAMPMGAAIGENRGPAWVAARYEAELRSAGLDVESGWPVFDLVLLGVGPDGHVLSVFPGSDAFDRPEWVLPVPAPTHIEPKVTRVTLNPHVLDVARSVLVVAHGAGKAAILGEVFGPTRDARRWPAQLARRPGATWLLDEAAAARLPQAVSGRRT
ncbi:MAG: 6-phosphogluconolactonase [Chloroflexota bacterium]|nr:6-phosphogluconolactonase [Chloroflexota bacterium]